MTIESLPRRDLARPVLRLAFTVAWSVGALLAMAVTITVANAATSGDPDAAACTRIDGERARLACFDAAFPRRGPAAGAARTSTPAAPAEAVFSVNDTVRRARGEQSDADRAPERIESTVEHLDPIAPGRVRVTLANGQVWGQVEASTRVQPRAGETITVRQASLGSFLMSAGRGGAVRARRLR